MKYFFVTILVLVVFSGCKEVTLVTEVAVEDSRLVTLFKASNPSYPNISVHRGGKGLLNFPENCLETLRYINDSISAVYEIDVAQTKDGQLVLLHDNTIDRTTTGAGKVSQFTYDELKNFNLVDDYGNETTFKIPLFSDVLNWCLKHNVILTIDIKRSVSQESVIKAIRRAKAEAVSIIITYDAQQAKTAHKLAPDLLLSVAARNNEEFDRLLNARIPTEKMLAFTGIRLSDASLYKRLHAKNMVCMLGTLGNLDKKAQAKGDELYNEWKNIGIDIFATDRPFEAYNAIN